MTLVVQLHDIESASFHEFTSGGKRHGSVSIKATNGDDLTLYDSPLLGRSIADAVNQPVPDLLCDIDPRLGEVTQTGEHEYRYGEYIICKQRPPIPGNYWSWIDDQRGGGEAAHEGTCNSLLACMDECDEHCDEMAEIDAEIERAPGPAEMAGDDLAHAKAAMLAEGDTP